MVSCGWLSTVREWLVAILCSITRRKTISISALPSTTAETSSEMHLEDLREKIYCAGDCDLHDILRQRSKLDWPEWHLNIDENDKAIQIAKGFHKDFEKLKLSSSIAGQVRTIEETFLNFLPTDSSWNQIRKYFQQARQQNNLLAIIKAYTCSSEFTGRLNKHSAANTHHLLKLYCTLLNCPVLAYTQEYTEAFTSILFHPSLDQYLVRNETVYRGIFLQDEKPIANYREGVIIITTTFLSTSRNRDVAELFGGTSPGGISIFSTYNINNIRRHTALDIGRISHFPGENEVLILRYAPFKITSLIRTEDGRRIDICLDECAEQSTV
ncbi:unnamed protein product [Rotaria sp. Silwood1]|nr:unnamed protein product [Rotaria sp. Silwood1]CAF1469255.1 unnamed protein product [Rotaria sp. Silwood1]CAF1472711.1 unnamed protein product [Rotaria sp. Silwood1]CAF3653047.1 unnamed protein product [Rotaria sp. Silwood1]CAF3667213.1 unnamed protein product [Rotaria sp. Silwood1]